MGKHSAEWNYLCTVVYTQTHIFNSHYPAIVARFIEYVKICPVIIVKVKG